jgi:glycosyltransferase involved in cell wall biosynthesis
VIRDGESGLLVPYADVASLARAFERLRDDEGLRMRLAEEGRRVAATFSFEETTDRFVALLAASA